VAVGVGIGDDDGGDIREVLEGFGVHGSDSAGSGQAQGNGFIG
jgi:hypothetical protein